MKKMNSDYWKFLAIFSIRNYYLINQKSFNIQFETLNVSTYFPLLQGQSRK